MTASIIGTLSTIELAAFLLGWGGVVEFVPDNRWGFLMRPSQVVYTYGQPVEINSLGLRGPELRIPKLVGTKRVVFVGDSVTYGGGRIREQQLFCRIVESRANDEQLSVEAVNLSAPAWSPQNWWGYIENRGLHEADMVVLVLPECDLARIFADMDVAGHRKKGPRFRIESLALKLQARFGHERLSAKHDPKQVIAANRDAVLGLKQACSDIHLLVVLIPSGVPCQPNEDLWSVFMPHLTDVVDLREELQDPGLFLDGAHLSVKGHEYVGERIFPIIRDRLLSKQTPSG